MRRRSVVVRGLAWALLAACLGQPTYGEDEGEGGTKLPEWLERIEISGYVFGDAYDFASHDDDLVDGQNGFWIRRIYLTVDAELSDTLESRVRLEMNSPGDFEDSTNLEPFVKNAYLSWRYRDDHRLIVGLAGTPTFELIERIWGYRQVEKTPVDLQRMAPSADLGLTAKGTFGGNDRFGYHAMLANGSGTRGEIDSGKKSMLALQFRPAEHFVIEAYGDTESRPGHTDRSMGQIFGAFDGERVRAGLQWSRQRQDLAAGGSRDLDLFSAFGAFELSRRVSLLARYDHMSDPNPAGPGVDYLPFDGSHASRLAILGVDLALHPRINLIPNVEAVFYDDEGGTEPDETVVPRLTLYWRF